MSDFEKGENLALAHLVKSMCGNEKECDLAERVLRVITNPETKPHQVETLIEYFNNFKKLSKNKQLNDFLEEVLKKQKSYLLYSQIKNFDSK